tara:strand:- start:6499 stop:7359 length:861 start_codon:yes stop_codon:yes gene_type:complete
MHPATSATFAISGSLLFIGVLFLGTGTPIPLFDPAESEEVEFSFSGKTTTLYFEQTDSKSNNGWAVYIYGSYNDSDGDGLWDDCIAVDISLLNESGEDFHYPICEVTNQRDDVIDMIYIGQLCFDPNNLSSLRCSDGNYSMEAQSFVRIAPEYDKKDDSLFVIIGNWLREGLVSGSSLICGGLFLLLLALFLSLALPDKEEEEQTKKRSGPTAEWRAYSLSGQERGADGMPKAFSRHSEKKDLFRKPRKGNVIGGVHKSGGLYLEGWKSEDSDAAYKKKVKDRRNE